MIPTAVKSTHGCILGSSWRPSSACSGALPGTLCSRRSRIPPGSVPAGTSRRAPTRSPKKSQEDIGLRVRNGNIYKKTIPQCLHCREPGYKVNKSTLGYVSFAPWFRLTVGRDITQPRACSPPFSRTKCRANLAGRRPILRV